MRCSKCGSDNREGRKFCTNCGTPLAAACAKCSAPIQPGEKFCGECGAAVGAFASLSRPAPSQAPVRVSDAVPATEVIDGERKTVTALFADIKGSMELMEDLDPEEARAIVDPALKVMIDAVRRYDGHVIQSTGDGIFALFGAPMAHEDHPQRALYAALRMQDDMRRFAERLRAEKGINLQVRVGANVGEVVVRSIQTGERQAEYTPIGHSISVASRLQTLANPGSIAIGDSLRKLVEGYFRLNALGPARIKGSSEPVNLYEVVGLGPLRTRLQRAAGRGLTKFVGREREMEALGHAAALAREGRGQIVAAMADPGMGKSRLFYEFKATSASGWMVLDALSISHGKASAYLPVIDLLRNYFEISAADDERKRREKVTGRVVALDKSLEDTLPYVFSLLGIVEGDDPTTQMDGQVKKRRTHDAIKRIVLRESLNQPLMLIFEDLHWMDGESETLLNLFADSIATAKILLLVNYRPEYSHGWGSKTYYTQLRLDPLTRDNAEEMLTSLLGDEKDLILLKRLIGERTQSTPFFMEEMAQAMFEEGVLQRNGAVKLVRPLSAVKIPATVQAVLAARIDRLSAPEKELLQTLAVLGREFSLSLAQHVTLKSVDDLEQMLSRLQLGEFVYEQPAVGEVEYSFKHALTQEVAYNALLIERRKLLHERAGAALESMFAERLDDHLGDLARHYSRSDNFSKAVEYLGRAGQQGLQRCAYVDAINSLNAALNLLKKLPDSPQLIQQELLLQLALGPALIAIQGYAAPEVERAYTRARELCEQLGDTPEMFLALHGLWLLYLVPGELRKANEIAEQLLRRAQGAHDQTLQIYAQLARGVTSYWMGDFITAREHLESATPLYDPERHRALIFRYGLDARIVCFTLAAWALWQLGYPDQAAKRGNEALTWGQRLSHPFSLVYAHCFVGVLHQLRREARAAQENEECSIALCAEHGFTEFLGVATTLRNWASAEQGRDEDEIAQLQQALTATRVNPYIAEQWRPHFLCLLAELYMETGRFGNGLSALAEALAVADEHGDHHNRAEMHRLKGELLLKQSDSNAARARSCFERAIEIAREQSAKSWELRATTSLARLLDKQGRRDEARMMLAGIYNWFTEGFDTADLKDAKALLDELSD
jgi:class 3 adenylate cyclase/predicted ATPase